MLKGAGPCHMDLVTGLDKAGGGGLYHRFGATAGEVFGNEQNLHRGSIVPQVLCSHPPALWVLRYVSRAFLWLNERTNGLLKE